MPDGKNVLSTTDISVPVPETTQEDPADTHPLGAEFKALPRSYEPALRRTKGIGPLLGERRFSGSFEW